MGDEESPFDSLGLFRPWTVDPARPSSGPTRHSQLNPDCWLAQNGVWEGLDRAMPPCDGRLVKAHLLKREVMRRHLPSAMFEKLEWDPRVWVWACGGPTGLAGHHGAFDTARRLRVPRLSIPDELEELCKQKQVDLTWWLDLTYARRARQHARVRRATDGDIDR